MSRSYSHPSRIYIIASGIYPFVMLSLILLYVAIGLAALFVWHFYFTRKTRQRAFEVLGWIEGLLSGEGHVAGLKWESASRFHVPLRLRSNCFRNASLSVHFISKELPLNWVAAKLKDAEETVVFEADLDWAPPFDLELQCYRVFARTRKDLPADAPGWECEQTTPFVLTTRKSWQKEITGVITNLLSCPERPFRSIAFRRQSPHFVAALALESIAPSSPCRTEILNSLRELATGASAPQI